VGFQRQDAIAYLGGICGECRKIVRVFRQQAVVDDHGAETGGALFAAVAGEQRQDAALLDDLSIGGASRSSR
jgi:hypothetical protein